MKYHTLFLSKTRKDVQNLSSAAVVIGALRVKQKTFSCVFLQALFKSLSTILLQFMQNIFFI